MPELAGQPVTAVSLPAAGEPVLSPATLHSCLYLALHVNQYADNLAHNVWDPQARRPKIQVIYNFRCEDHANCEALQRLVASFFVAPRLWRGACRGDEATPP